MNDSIQVRGFPERITIELTNKCNYNCTFCPRKLMEKQMGFLEFGLAEKLISEISRLGPVSIVPFFRGEPLLHPRWLDILTMLKDAHTGQIQLATNGSLLDKTTAEKLLDIGVDFISFSLDTTDPEIYEQTRCSADFQKVLDNIFTFIELKEKRGNAFPEIQVSTIETDIYKPCIDKFIRFWQPKVDKVRVYIEHSQDGHPGSISQPLPDFEERLPCKKVFTDMVIYWDGEVALCNHDWNRQKPHLIANINDASISEVWHSAKYEEIRDCHRSGQFDKEPLCEHCDHWKMYYIPNGFLGEVYTRNNPYLSKY